MKETDENWLKRALRLESDFGGNVRHEKWGAVADDSSGCSHQKQHVGEHYRRHQSSRHEEREYSDDQGVRHSSVQNYADSLKVYS